MEVLDLSWPTTAEAPSALSPPMYPLSGPFKRGWKQSKMKHILCKERKKETCANMDTCNLYTTSQTQNLFPLLWFEPNHRFESLKKGLQNGYIWFVLPVQICLACTHICIWTLKGWIYELVYIMYLRGAGSCCNFVWQALSELLGAEGVKSMKAEPSWIGICHWSQLELYISSLIAGCPEIVGLGS